MVNRLKMPERLAGIRAQRNHRIRVQIVARAFAAEIIGAGAAGWHEHHVASRIGSNDGPGVSRTRVSGTAVCPSSSRGIARVLRDRIPGPFELTGDNVEAAHFAARLVDGAVVGNSGTDDDCVSDDRGRRCLFIVGVIMRRDAKIAAQIDDAIVSEIGAKLAGGGIERDQARVDRGDEDAKLTRRRLPGRDAAMRVVSITGIFVDVRIIGPTLAAI